MNGIVSRTTWEMTREEYIGWEADFLANKLQELNHYDENKRTSTMEDSGNGNSHTTRNKEATMGMPSLP